MVKILPVVEIILNIHASARFGPDAFIGLLLARTTAGIVPETWQTRFDTPRERGREFYQGGAIF